MSLRAVSTSALPTQPVRAITLGTSHQAFGFLNTNIPTTAGSFVVSGGIATITAGGNQNVGPGNYVNLQNTGDPTFALALNGANVPVLTAPSNPVITVSATVNGVTMANGDYSNINGVGWTVQAMLSGRDSSVIKYLNYFAGNPLLWVANYAIIGGLAAWALAIMPKVLQGPKFELAIIDAGTNEVGGGTPPGSIAAGLQDVQDAYINLVNIALQLLNYGAKVIILTDPPIPATIANAINSNVALGQLCQQLRQFAEATQNVYVFDLWKDTILGTSATGDMVANYAHASNDVHLSSFADYVIGKQEAANILVPITRIIELAPVSVLDDSITTAQALPGWAANTGYTVTTGPALYRVNFGNIYQLLATGTSAVSGNGPSGTGQAIQDGTCVWRYVAVEQRNLVQHGMMDGTVACTATGFTGTQPTTWVVVGSEGGGSPTNVTVTSAGQAARNAVTGTNQSNWGYAWDLNATFSAAGSFAIQSNDWGGQWRSAVANFGGGTFRAGITVASLSASSAINKLTLIVKAATAANFMLVAECFPGNNTTTIPLANGDLFELSTQSFVITPGVASTQSQMYFTVASSAVGACHVQLSNAWCKRVISPYSY